MLGAEKGGIVVTLYPRRTPILLTIDAPDESTELFGRVGTLEYESSNAWRITCRRLSTRPLATPVCTENLSSGVVVMKSAQDGA
jgi:hypothetical protein